MAQNSKIWGVKKMGNFLTFQKLPVYGPASGQSVTYSTRKPGGFMQSCVFPCIVKFLVHLLQYLKDTIDIIPQTTTKYVVLYENWVTQIWKIVIQLDSTNQYENFDMQHANVMIKIKEVMSNPIFLSFTACSHSNFLWLLFRYIHLICTCLSMHNMLI